MKKGKFFLFAICVFSGFLFAGKASAATNINSSTTLHWAWNDLVGWIDFYNTQTITVSSQNLTGYASSSVGDISLDCHTTRNGNICGQSQYQVTNNGLGNLGNWGWNDEYGWISFNCANNPGGCNQSNYGVVINPTTGDFSNYAWNDTLGWISFNCTDPNVCNTSNYKVNTSWTATSTSAQLDSATFDSGVSSATLNSFLWSGPTLPSGTRVQFQFATSNSSSGPWTFVGTDGTSATYYTTGPDASLMLGFGLHVGRYFRYRTVLTSNQAQTSTPQINDVFVNWSP